MRELSSLAKLTLQSIAMVLLTGYCKRWIRYHWKGSNVDVIADFVTNLLGQKEVVVAHNELSAIYSFDDEVWRLGLPANGIFDYVASVRLEGNCTFLVIGGSSIELPVAKDSIYKLNAKSYEFDLLERRLSRAG